MATRRPAFRRQHRAARARGGDALLLLDYAMSVIVGRALPDVRDGLKPVHRRVLFGMNELGLQPNRPYSEERQGRRRGDGQLPPARRLSDLRHARPPGAGLLAALPARRRPGQLRLGRRRSGRRHAVHRGPPRGARARDAARPRRRHGRLRTPNYDGSRQEPLVLPARFPNLLVNGSSGIAVGMATNIPPHNLRRDDRGDDRLHRRPRRSTIEGLMTHIKGPDFPTGGLILGMTGHPRRVRDRPRPRAHARPRAHRAAVRTARRRSSSPSCRSPSRRAATAV